MGKNPPESRFAGRPGTPLFLGNLTPPWRPPPAARYNLPRQLSRQLLSPHNGVRTWPPRLEAGGFPLSPDPRILRRRTTLRDTLFPGDAYPGASACASPLHPRCPLRSPPALDALVEALEIGFW